MGIAWIEQGRRARRRGGGGGRAAGAAAAADGLPAAWEAEGWAGSNASGTLQARGARGIKKVALIVYRKKVDARGWKVLHAVDAGCYAEG